MGEEFDRTGMYAKERKARPLEAAVMLLHDEMRGYVKLRHALMNDDVSRNLDPESTLAVRVERKIAEVEQRVESRAGALANERRQFVQAEREQDEWASPSAHGEGWLCADSETGVCIYENDEYCTYCHFPAERK